jgi:hypothetical protein
MVFKLLGVLIENKNIFKDFLAFIRKLPMLKIGQKATSDFCSRFPSLPLVDFLQCSLFIGRRGKYGKIKMYMNMYIFRTTSSLRNIY